MKKIGSLLSVLGMLILFSACSNNPDQWTKLGRWHSVDKRMYFPGKMEEGQKWFYIGQVNRGVFKNFELSAKLKLSDEALAKFWFHTDKNLNKGYNVLLNNNNRDEKRRSGSLEDVRSRYKSIVAPGAIFNLTISVLGKNIKISINNTPMVEYVEPELPYRIPENKGMVLSEGLFAFEVLSGKLTVYEVSVKPVMEYVPKIVGNNTLQAIDETNDKIIRLEQQNFPIIDYHLYYMNVDKSRYAENFSRSEIYTSILVNKDVLPILLSTENRMGFFSKIQKDPSFWGIHIDDSEFNNSADAKETKSMFDYAVGDAMSIIDHKGRYIRLWMEEEVKIDIPVEKYMDVIVDNIVRMISEQDINIYVNPTYLPEILQDRYDELWTRARILKVVSAMARKGVALEINSQSRIPSLEFLKIAKAAGVKFAIGSNRMNYKTGNSLDYALEMIESLNLTTKDMFFPY